MNANTLIQWLNQPDVMTKDSQADLEQVLQSYPCFSAARVLYLKTLEQQNDLNYTAALFKTSLSIPDRKVLFYFMKGRPYSSTASYDEVGFSLIDNFLEKQQTSGNEETTLMTFSGYSLEKEYGDGREEVMSDPIIQQFLDHPEEQIEKSDIEKEVVMEKEAALEEKPAIPELSFTETLAKIYLQQKKYEQAVEIFKSLMVRNPEKSIYFADQIRFLEKLINHLNK